MSKFTGTKPSAQPRTLRSIAEEKNSSFEAPPAYDAQAGIPATAHGAGQHYDASDAHPAPVGKVPFRTGSDPDPIIWK